MSTQNHILEYAKTGRAKCHGKCKGMPISKGAIRYGRMYTHQQYGETVSWMHWECIGTVLGKLATVRLENVPGFRSLRPEDQEMIRSDIKSRRIGSMVSELPVNGHVDESPKGSQKRKAESSPSRPSIGSSQSQAMEEDIDEYFDDGLDEVKDELYITLPAKVVGLQYYKGMVGPDEEVTLVREPLNKYDPNAIQVLNISGTQVGHIPRNVSGKLAPLIDSNLVTVEGVIHDGNLNNSQYTMSITLKIYGASHKRAQLEPLLNWTTPKQQGFTDAMRPAGYQNQASDSNTDYSYAVSGRSGPSRSQPLTRISPSQFKAMQDRLEAVRKAAELRSLLSSLEKVDDEGRRTSLLDSVCSTDDVLNLPEHPSPPSVASGQLTVDLLRHQSQALQWCLERENPSLPEQESDRPVQFWQLKLTPGNSKKYYLNLATKTPQEDKPLLGRGGLMADAMGLGKTLTMLALVVATKRERPSDFSNTTLIVVPLSVLTNWKAQISEHCTNGTLTYHIYYDTGRNVDHEYLSEFDVVITTYQVVAQDYSSHNGIPTKIDMDGKAKKKNKYNGGLFSLKWKRIILDEGHTIRNSKTKMATAVRGLDAQRRWVVTGTPIINSPKDLGSLLQFLQICRPLDNEEYYKRLLLRPLAQGDPEGAELLRALMSHICIRRTKEMQNNKGEHLVPLPPVEMTLIPVQLDTATRKLYDEVESLSKERFTSYIELQRISGGHSMPATVLSLLTRLRQLALHPGLVPQNYVEQLRSMLEDPDKPAPAIPITPADRIRLSAILARAIEDREECPICFDIASDPRITPCAHIFCSVCILEAISRDARCPMDRRTISISDLIEPPLPTEFTQAPPPEPEEDTGLRAGASAKIDQLVHLLQLTPKTEKSLVFSQFTGFLDKISDALEENGIPYVRFDGQMSVRRRQEVLERFSIPLEVKDAPPNPKRPRRSTSKVILDSDDCDSQDKDFVVKKQGDDDDSFPDDSDEDTLWTGKKGKGKGKVKSRPKRSTPSQFALDYCDDSFLHDSDEDNLSTAKKGKGKAKATIKSRPKRSTQSQFALDDRENPVVMLISLKAGALGLNLTVANNVYLMDPWWQEGIESQAIDRCNRIGQTKPVHVYQLVAENTVEAKVLEIQERKKKFIKQAFSGIKTTETQRQKKEARLQDLVELFGVRRDVSAS